LFKGKMFWGEGGGEIRPRESARGEKRQRPQWKRSQKQRCEQGEGMRHAGVRGKSLAGKEQTGSKGRGRSVPASSRAMSRSG
jgi:hypothetical protein